MKTLLTGLVLVVLSGGAWAQAGALTNATVADRSSIDDPAVAIREMSGEWLAFSMPVIEGTRSPCCWQGKWSSGREVGCSLDEDHYSYGTRSESLPAQRVITYARVSAGEVQSVRLLGEECPVDGAGAEVTWIGSTDTRASLNWLEGVARTGAEGVRETALYATALHRSPDATERLYKLAAETDADLSDEAIFWLGETRGGEGFQALDTLLDELPAGDTRRQINFALAQNGTSEAFDRLVEISRNDSDAEQRGNAMFWLAEEFPDKAGKILLESLADEHNEAALEQAVFAIAQLPESQGTGMLLELAQDPSQPRNVRRQALFWLANSDDDEAVAALEELLTR
jgi:hypothetical protein